MEILLFTPAATLANQRRCDRKKSLRIQTGAVLGYKKGSKVRR